LKPAHGGILQMLDPRTKLIWMLAITCTIAFTLSLTVHIILTVYIIVLSIVSRIQWKSIRRALALSSSLFAITLALHILFGDKSGEPLADVIGIQVTSGALQSGALYSYRIILMLLALALTNSTTSSMDLADGVLHLIRPLRHLKLPVGDLSTMLFVALRFVPVLADEARSIRMSQISRGLKSGTNPISRILPTRALLLPMMMCAVRRAGTLAVAVESRGYQPGVIRTSINELKLRWADFAFLASLVVILIPACYL
jgi:energy-coupling factor transport system permease protein